MKLIFCQQINTKVFHKLIVSLWLCVARHFQSTQSNKVSISFAISQGKREGWSWFFFLEVNIKSLSNWYFSFKCVRPGMPKFAISLQHLKKEVTDEVDFLHADKHESILKSIRWFLMGTVKDSQSSQNSKFAIIFTISQKRS